MNAIFPKVEEFLRLLEKQGGDFICSTCLPDSSVSVLFAGPFLGQTVLWNMKLATLAYYRGTSIFDPAAATPETYPCPFIEIVDSVEGECRIRVGLDIETIDTPAIRKTIIMIRNYRRLSIGKIEFCANNT